MISKGQPLFSVSGPSRHVRRWLLVGVAGSCSLQVLFNVKCQRLLQKWLLFAGGCLLDVGTWACLIVLQKF